MKNRRLPLIFLCVFAAAMLLAGRLTYKDYSLTIDEFTERSTTGLNYEYVMQTVFRRDVDVIEGTLQESNDRYYGVALQLPMMVMEALTDFRMPLPDAFRIRHLYTFLLCMAGWLCFYVFCRHAFKSRWLALLGFLMVALYPRFWGEQFTNIKDMVFAATCCASLMGIALCLEHEGRWRYEVLGACLNALCANTRFIGFQFPALLFGYRILRDWTAERPQRDGFVHWLKTRFVRYAAHLIIMFGVYILITPASWSDPFAFVGGVFGTFSDYTTWKGTVPFLGVRYPGSGLPWYYLTVSVLMCAPLWYLGLMFLGGGFGAGKLVKAIKEKRFLRAVLSDGRYVVLCAVTAAVPLIAPMLKSVTLYNSWRHAYYIFPCLVVGALYGARCLWHRLKAKPLRVCAVCAAGALLCTQTAWTALNHPYEKVYFNPIGRLWADEVDRDYWKESSVRQLEVILQNDPSETVSVAADDDLYRTVHYFLPAELSKRVRCVRDGGAGAEYVIDLADTFDEPERYEGCTPVYELRMHDGLLLSTVHVRDDVLAERFGGVYPAYNVQKKEN